jgi:SAM-dependent methyltransferase
MQAAQSIEHVPIDADERVACYLCGADDQEELCIGEDDLGGKAGKFRFVTCRSCGLAYQSPRIPVDRIGVWYDDEYIAHRKVNDFGPILTPLHVRAMNKHDADKEAIVSKYVKLDRAKVLDIGCAVGTFLRRLKQGHNAEVVGVDFKDLSAHPFMKGIEFHCGTFGETNVGKGRFDLVTMWHFLEHDYEPMATLAKCKEAVKADGRIVIEVPRLDSVSFKLYRERWPGLQAPQHTILFDKKSLHAMVEKAGLRVVDYLPYGAFPPYFYMFTGALFKLRKGRGLNPIMKKAMVPYYIGLYALKPILAFEKRLNLAMQTIVCAR